MYLELIDLFRCTASHEEVPLVAAIHARADRDIVSGVMGCPVCSATYRIENGIAIFGPGLGPEPDGGPDVYREPDDELAMRCAAMLNLFDPGGVVVLGGTWGRTAGALLEMTETSILLVEPPPGTRLGNGISAIRVGTTLPLAAGSVRGVALDAQTSAQTLVASAARALKGGGRLIASVAQAVPPGVVERARDDEHWVGDASAPASAPVQLAKASPR